jgi:hypothetical protein
VVLAGLLGVSARGDSILTLGVFTSLSEPTTNFVTPKASLPGFNLAMSDPTNQTVSTPISAWSVTTPAVSQPTSSAPAYDAFINLGSGPYLNANSLTSGGSQAWYDSSKLTGLFGGQPTAQQVASFDSTVLQRVEQTFALSGVPVTLTDNPNQPAAHMLSVVSNTVNPAMTNAIGMTNIGGNGFHFIDNSAPYAQTVDQLEWIVAHNVAHELMLAFGVPEVHDQTGQHIDSTVGSLSMFLNPNATFSAGAAQALLANNFLAANGSMISSQAQLLNPTPAPEPTTLAAWALVIGAVAVAHRRSSRLARA